MNFRSKPTLFHLLGQHIQYSIRCALLFRDVFGQASLNHVNILGKGALAINSSFYILGNLKVLLQLSGYLCHLNCLLFIQANGGSHFFRDFLQFRSLYQQFVVF